MWGYLRVCAHLFLCMLAYYVKWHMTEAWRPLVFADEDEARHDERDPVAAATRSEAALEKVASKQLGDGSPAHVGVTTPRPQARSSRSTPRPMPSSAPPSI